MCLRCEPLCRAATGSVCCEKAGLPTRVDLPSTAPGSAHRACVLRREPRDDAGRGGRLQRVCSRAKSGVSASAHAAHGTRHNGTFRPALSFSFLCSLSHISLSPCSFSDILLNLVTFTHVTPVVFGSLSTAPVSLNHPPHSRRRHHHCTPLPSRTSIHSLTRQHINTLTSTHTH